jgi:hypothetical protein
MTAELKTKQERETKRFKASHFDVLDYAQRSNGLLDFNSNSTRVEKAAALDCWCWMDTLAGSEKGIEDESVLLFLQYRTSTEETRSVR